MIWTYRMVRRVITGGAVEIGIYEAHGDAPDAPPHSISEDPIAPVADDEDGLRAELARMLRATGKPVLRWEDFEY